MNEVIYTSEDMEKIISFLKNQNEDMTIASLLSQIQDSDEMSKIISK